MVKKSRLSRAIPRVVIVGGGSGGLELATKLGRRLGKAGLAEVTLVDVRPTYLWKPLFHEVAAGTIDVCAHQLEYLPHARRNHFRFRLGAMIGLDKTRRSVFVAPLGPAASSGEQQPFSIAYDILVIAVGSISNDYGVKGVAEHCLFLDRLEQAQALHERLLASMVRAYLAHGATPLPVTVAIVGAGATGVELAAQLRRSSDELAAYGIIADRDDGLRLQVLEAAPRILTALPEALAASVTQRMRRMGIAVATGESVVEVTADGIRTATATQYQALFKVWAAGIKAPDFLADLGLETNRVNQLVVRRTLQSADDDDIFAFGDCAACPLDSESGVVPPLAQAAHQQASFLARAIRRKLQGQDPGTFRFRNYGSLVSLGGYGSKGHLMAGVLGNLTVSGLLAKGLYRSLYERHKMVLHGWTRTALLDLAHFLQKGMGPEIKLH